MNKINLLNMRIRYDNWKNKFKSLLKSKIENQLTEIPIIIVDNLIN